MKERRWLELACVIAIASIITLMVVSSIMRLSRSVAATVEHRNTMYQQYMDMLDESVPANAPEN